MAKDQYYTDTIYPIAANRFTIDLGLVAPSDSAEYGIPFKYIGKTVGVSFRKIEIDAPHAVKEFPNSLEQGYSYLISLMLYHEGQKGEFVKKLTFVLSSGETIIWTIKGRYYHLPPLLNCSYISGVFDTLAHNNVMSSDAFQSVADFLNSIDSTPQRITTIDSRADRVLYTLYAVKRFGWESQKSNVVGFFTDENTQNEKAPTTNSKGKYNDIYLNKNDGMYQSDLCWTDIVLCADCPGHSYSPKFPPSVHLTKNGMYLIIPIRYQYSNGSRSGDFTITYYFVRTDKLVKTSN